MTETPRANRIHIAFFGLRNAGKSTLVNAFTGQRLAIVSDTPGTTTDPVSKAMEILPLGPCLVTDTAGLDDVGALGEQRVRKTLEVLATTDVAVWVWGEVPPAGEATRTGEATDARQPGGAAYAAFLAQCRSRRVTVLEFRRGDSVAALREKIASLRLADDAPGLLDGLVAPGDRVVCVCPIDAAAPKGRLILPQVQAIRAALDLHATCEVCRSEELASVLSRPCGAKTLVITDSQAFGEVSSLVSRSRLASRGPRPSLTSFSILFARQKGDLGEYLKGLAALRALKDGDTVLIAEGCTHHRQCNDIGTVKIPRALAKLSGRKLDFVFASGGDFEVRAEDGKRETRGDARHGAGAESSNRTIERPNVSLVVQCGGCMLTRREVLRRIALAREAGIPIVNYGMVLAAASRISVEDDACCLASSTSRLSSHVSRPDKGVRRETRDESP